MTRILVIDDYQEVRNLYKETLEKNGCTVDAVENADLGIQKILEGGYDLILLDLLMPIKGATWILDYLKNQSPQKPNGKIIIMSFDGDDEETKRELDNALQNGAQGIFDKKTPIDNTFILKINEFLTR